MRHVIIILALALALAGCTKWVNPNIAEPDKESELLDHDEKYCTKWSEQMVPIQPAGDFHSPDMGFEDDPSFESVVSDDVTAYDQNYKQNEAFERCMRNRGWIKHKRF